MDRLRDCLEISMNTGIKVLCIIGFVNVELITVTETQKIRHTKNGGSLY